MPPVRRQIEVHAPPSAVAAQWSHFVDAALTGSQKLACDELACVDAVHSGLVSFEPAGGGQTTVVFDVAADGAGPPPEVVEQRVTRDLVVFKDYVERGGNQVGRPTRAEKKAMLDDADRHGHRQPQARISEQGETAAYVDQFPT
ncbi:MAG: hypothetical protein WC709_12250 [Thermoleophilia bacterium]